MSNDSIDSFVKDTNPVDYVKEFTAYSLAMVLGYILGINYTAGAAKTKYTFAQGPPGWVAQVKTTQWLAIVAAVGLALAWMYLDYTDR